MKIVWALFCETVIVDKGTNRVSLINVMDEITIPAPLLDSETTDMEEPLDADESPGIDWMPDPGLTLVMLSRRSDLETPEENDNRIRIVHTQSNQTVAVSEARVDLTQARQTRGMATIPSFLIFQKPGMYLCKIDGKRGEGEWEEIFEAPLWVHVQQDSPT